MKGAPPLVTIISPCYNHERYIIESLDSIRLQTYSNMEHIIIDDCSKDRSAELIEEWIKMYDYPCTFIRHTKNEGVGATMNKSIDMAKGYYWTALATDDVAKPERTQVFVDFMESAPAVNMVTSDCTFIDEHSKPVERSGTSSFLTYYTQGLKNFSAGSFGFYEQLLLGNHIPSSTLFRTDIFKKAGKFQPGLVMEDWEMWLRISRFGRIEFIPAPMTLYRFHPSNSFQNLREMEWAKAKTILDQHQYCKKNGLSKAYNRAYTENLFFSPFRHPYLTARVMLSGPVHLYIAEVFRRATTKVFKKKK